MVEPSGTAAPKYVQGPTMSGAECTAIFPPVEKRKYVPSDLRTMDGSCALVQMPVQVSGLAYPATKAMGRNSDSPAMIEECFMLIEVSFRRRNWK
ncbi:hypothetical protein P3T76_005024 [Phytophthora citrophthora]|uniref:Uncharacterized protein n=1 Tax=Phytophthora citrophthora TaxID=4793 RepID=A0AAD9LN91_9STRA|nr:hypothetical protein P3T76_005024 [Phytophthora citrophthora]